MLYKIKLVKTKEEVKGTVKVQSLTWAKTYALPEKDLTEKMI